MGKRIFEVYFSGWVKIELDDQVIDVVDDEWRSHLYNLRNPKEIAEHIAYNFVFNNGRLSMLDGWADQPDTNARIIDEGEIIDFEVKEYK